MRHKLARGDPDTAEIASRQHGVVSRAQLLAAGVSPSAISRRVRSGRLHRVHRGVYAVGHSALSPQGRWMAAVLAVGRPDKLDRTATPLERWGAAVSHRSAAELWELLAVTDGSVDISVTGYGGRARRRGIHVHRSITLLPADVTLHEAIPATKPARTIADLRRIAGAPARAGRISNRDLRRAIREADALGLEIGGGVGPDPTRSELERVFLRLCRRHGLPMPAVNVRVGGFEVDFLWPARQLIVETDGYRYHRGRAAFDDDRERDLALRGLGYEVIRLSSRQLQLPGRVAKVLEARLRDGVRLSAT